MTNNHNRDDDNTPRNPRINLDPALEAAGLGAINLSVDDMLSTAAACFSCARVGHDAMRAGDTSMAPAQIAQLYQLAACWLRVVGNPKMEADIRAMEATAADVIREAAAGDLDRIRRTSH
jgi:hypothetical protein